MIFVVNFLCEIDEQTNKTTQRDQMQLPLSKENDSNEEIGRQNNAQQESKLCSCCCYCYCAIIEIFPFDLSLEKNCCNNL